MKPDYDWIKARVAEIAELIEARIPPGTQFILEERERLMIPKPTEVNFPPWFEILGLYVRAEHRIILAIEHCREVSHEMGLDPDHLLKVVAVHETAHFVHHVGEYKATTAQRVMDYGTEVVENMAQETTYLYLKKHSPELLEAFKKLSEESAPEYRQWGGIERILDYAGEKEALQYFWNFEKPDLKQAELTLVKLASM